MTATSEPPILRWFERQFSFGLSPRMLPFYLERLEGAVPRLEARVAGVADSVLSAKPDGKWSIKQHIGHLAEVDQIALRRIAEMVDGEAELSPAVFEPRGDYGSMPVARVIDLFRDTRRANLERYASLRPEQLVRGSRHPRLGAVMTPVDLAWFDAEHDDHHLVAVRAQLDLLNG